MLSSYKSSSSSCTSSDEYTVNEHVHEYDYMHSVNRDVLQKLIWSSEFYNTCDIFRYFITRIILYDAFFFTKIKSNHTVSFTYTDSAISTEIFGWDLQDMMHTDFQSVKWEFIVMWDYN